MPTNNNPFTEEELSIHVNNYLRPEILHNTAFIAEPPETIRKYYIDRMRKFMGAHKITATVFSEYFLSDGLTYDKFVSGEKSPYLSKIEESMYAMQEYDKELRKKPTFGYRKKDMKKIIYEQIELFCLRQNITLKTFSEVFFGLEPYLFWFKKGSVSCKMSRIDNIFYMMHKEDLVLIEKMGPRYDEWLKREGNI
jgi:hypothetical protein